mgnify:CR=1 FL=1
MERIFNLDPQLLQDALFLAVNIFVLFVAGSYLLYNPVRNLLKKRQDMVQADIDAARKDKEDAAALKSEYDAKIKTADKDADAILAEARKKATAREQQIVEEAKTEASRLIGVEAELEKKRVSDEVKKEMIAVAAAMAGKVVSRSMDAGIQDSLVEETLNEMGEETWQS